MKRIRLTWVAYAIMICSLTTFAQPDTLWTRTYGINGAATELMRSDDGDILMVSGATVEGRHVFNLCKISLAGDSIWSMSFEEADFSGRSKSASKLANGNFIVLADSANEEGPLDNESQKLYEITQEGDVVGVRQFADSVWWVNVGGTPDSCYILQGLIETGDDIDLVLTKYRLNGEIVWTFNYGQPELGERAWDMEVDELGRTLLVGLIQGEVGQVYHLDSWIAVIDPVGELEWERIYPIDYNQQYDVWNLQCGMWASDGIYVSGSMDVQSRMYGWVVKLDFEGDSLWSRLVSDLSSPNSMWVKELTWTEDGGIAGIGGNGSPSSPFWFRMNSSGEQFWEECCPESPFGREIATNILTLEDGSYVIAGYAYNEFDERVVRLTRTTPDIVSTSPTGELPSSIVLHANYPNPFNATTEIRFDLPRAMQTSLKVYDVLGREVAELAGGVMNAGPHTIIYDASGQSSGVYFYRLEAGEFGETRKMVLLK